ncbi:ABC transporter ATP-binding protein [Candidatus Neomicrothrix sp.]|jgi:molybdate transport system ATP-binding protein|uniref:ABC transporter ATP-binding protein n=1 Tax=Candidatus Neomicrothrix sp. TaxID=2719034 RepID=UPI002B779C5A|nr:ABC transporter ATP-binding protein [Candidatus Microthrix sp.]HMS49598.1 ABC transporter ATP-binding protein [Candidatus Microthrix sp.]
MAAAVVSLEFDGTLDLGRFVLDAAFSCAPGETIALVGPNGSGKSTALNLLAGLLRLSSGSLTLDGTVLDQPSTGRWVASEHRGVGVVFQDLLLLPHLSVRDNVAYGPRRAGGSRETADAVASDWLERFGVEDLADERPRSLSGGQAQRVALARALARDPRLLLLDEPLSALDSETRLEVRCELHRHLAEFGGMTVLVAHDVVDVLVLADRVVVFDEGRVAQVAEPAALERRPLTQYAAALVGTNLLRGYRRGAVIELGDRAEVAAPRAGSDGPVDLVIAPRHVSVALPDGPNGVGSWTARIAGLEAAGNDVHIRVGGPVPIAAMASLESLRDLHLSPGAMVDVHVDPSHLKVFDAVTSLDVPRSAQTTNAPAP